MNCYVLCCTYVSAPKGHFTNNFGEVICALGFRGLPLAFRHRRQEKAPLPFQGCISSKQYHQPFLCMCVSDSV